MDEMELASWIFLFSIFGVPLLATLGVSLAGWRQKRRQGERSEDLRVIIVLMAIWDGAVIGLLTFVLGIFVTLLVNSLRNMHKQQSEDRPWTFA